jgi:hypothetical protein
MGKRPVFILTIHQPWATLMACGLKTIETRSWRTSYVGLVALHAGLVRDHLSLVESRAPFAIAMQMAVASDVLPATWWPDTNARRATYAHALPLGAIVAIGHLCYTERVEILVREGRTAREHAFGNYDAGRFGWVFDRVVPLERPIPSRGAQGIRAMTVEDDGIVESLRRQWLAKHPETEPRYLGAAR